MSITLALPTAPVTEGAPEDTSARRVPVAGGEPITTDGVTLAVCMKADDTEPYLCRLAVSTGAYRPTGRVMDFARALAGGLIAVPAPVKPAAAVKAGGE